MICRYPKVHDAHWVQKDAYDLHGRKWCAGRTVEAGPHETLSRKELIALLEAVLALHPIHHDVGTAPVHAIGPRYDGRGTYTGNERYVCGRDGEPWPCRTVAACGSASND